MADARALRILFVVPEFGEQIQGGIARFYKHAVEGLVSAGHKVDVCVASEHVQDHIENGVSIRGLRLKDVQCCESELAQFDLAPALRGQLARAAAAFEICRRGAAYDIVETTDWDMLYVPWLTRAPRQAAVVVQLHGGNGQVRYHDPLEGEELSALLTRMIETAILPRADALHTSGIQNVREWQALLDRPVTQILPAWQVAPLHQQEDAFGYGLVASRLQVWKGPEVLCAAIELLGDDAPKVVWAGHDQPYLTPGNFVGAHLKTAFPNTWEKQVIPVGGQPPHVVAELQKHASFYVHPSTWEVFGLSVVEAMAAGKVVVCSKQSGASCLIRHGENGFVFDSTNPNELAKTIREASRLASASSRRLGEAAHRDVAAALDPAKITQERIALYSELQQPRACEDHPWLTNIFAPKQRATASSILENVPARTILEHLIGRLTSRIRRTFGALHTAPGSGARAAQELRNKELVSTLLAHGKSR